ncbi:MAG: hypothetical protein KAS71_02260, partial [Bacteroidales bacterium]|nr:hypothetical protein [Bacteroidales bacterium]
ISNDKIEMLKNRIEKVNTLDAVGLKKLYKEVRLTGKFSEVSGAGIGIIDMARKSENKLTYDFTAIDDAHSMYSLQIDIHKNVNIKTK